MANQLRGRARLHLVAALCTVTLSVGCNKKQVSPAEGPVGPQKPIELTGSRQAPSATSPEKPVPESKADPLAAFKKQSAANLKEIASAYGFFAKQNEFLPMGLVDPRTGQIGLSWRVQLLPYLSDPKAHELYKEFHLDEPWNSEHNRPLLSSMPTVFAPVRGRAPEGYTYYQGFAPRLVGPKGEEIDFRRNAQRSTGFGYSMFPDPREYFFWRDPNAKPESGKPVPVREVEYKEGLTIPDGTLHTIVAVEAGEPVPWTRPEDVPFAICLDVKPGEEPKAPRLLGKLGGMFDGDFHMVMFYGNVHFVRRDAPWDKLWPFIGRANGIMRDFTALGLEEFDPDKSPK